MSRILIVEDERAIADIVAFNLNRENYETERRACPWPWSRILT